MNQTIPSAVTPAQPQNGGGRHLNKRPLYLLGGVAVAILFALVLAGMNRGNDKQASSAEAGKAKGNSLLYAKELTDNRRDGIIAASYPALPEEPGYRPDNPDLPPQPRALPSPQYQADIERIRQLKQQQFEEALKAKTGVQLPQTQNRPTPDAGLTVTPANPDPMAQYQKRLAQVRRAGIGAGAGMGDEGEGIDEGQEHGAPGKPKNDIASLGGNEPDKWRLDSKPQPPRPYSLQTTFVIPATLISGINSTLPGKIFGQVNQNVYDTATGKYMLIPQGTKLEGVYSSDVAYGQASLLVAWQRLVFPDGKTMDIGAMPGSNGAGYAGFSDQVNNHYVRLFGSAIIMSAITAGVALSQSRNQIAGTFGAPTTNTVLSAALGQQLGRVTSQLISKNMNISPTLEIRPGYRFNVTVIKDMVFGKPYQAFDY